MKRKVSMEGILLCKPLSIIFVHSWLKIRTFSCSRGEELENVQINFSLMKPSVMTFAYR